MKMHLVLVWRNFRCTASSVPWVWLLRHNRVCTQTICAPLLQNAQYATEVRKFSAHTRNVQENIGNCVMKMTKYPDVGSTLLPAKFYTHFAIDFSERAIKEKNDRSIMLTARMGRYGVKVALLRCLIRLIIKVIENKLYSLPASIDIYSIKPQFVWFLNSKFHDVNF